MKREVRNNLIFLGVLLVLMAPGAVILFNKKSTPGERPIGSPDPVRQTTAYMDPYPPETTERLAPVKTLQWIGGVATEGFPGNRLTRPTESPAVNAPSQASRGSGNVGSASPFERAMVGSTQAQVMSRGRWFQVIARGGGLVRVIIWDQDADPAKGRLAALADGEDSEIVATTRKPLPKDIRHDLQSVGFVLPPEWITIIDLRAADGVKEIAIRFSARSERMDVAELP
jgi:hypothetical protein